jgi:putative RecB family exonuclease
VIAPTSEPEIKTRIEVLTEEVSASRLSLWFSCRLKFYFRYVAQIQKPPTPALTVGKVVHAVLQEWNRARWKGDFSFRENLTEVFQQRWQEQVEEVEWDGKEAKERLTALGLLELYLDQTPIQPEERPQGVEVQLEADLVSHGLLSQRDAEHDASH